MSFDENTLKPYSNTECNKSQPTPLLSRGFTIVELLIVVVVIAILAAITIVSYNGITAQAEDSALKSALRTASNKVSIEQVKEGVYPEDLPAEIGVDTDTRILVYTGGENYCITAFSKKSSGKAFYISSEKGDIEEGNCTGHSIPVPPTTSACFNFDSGIGTITDYYDNEGNNSANPACPRDVVIPSRIGGVEVEILGDDAFRDNQLTSVTIPGSVTSIGLRAFQGNQLTSVVIPDSVTLLGNNSFYNNRLTSVTIPGSVASMGSYAFAMNQLTSVTIPNSVDSMQDSVFRDNQLTSITIPDSVIYIRSYAFGNNKLTSVTISDSVTLIASYAFWRNQLTSVTIPDHVTSMANFAFQENQLGSVSVPSHLSGNLSLVFFNNPSPSFTIRP